MTNEEYVEHLKVIREIKHSHQPDIRVDYLIGLLISRINTEAPREPTESVS